MNKRKAPCNHRTAALTGVVLADDEAEDAGDADTAQARRVVLVPRRARQGANLHNESDRIDRTK